MIQAVNKIIKTTQNLWESQGVYMSESELIEKLAIALSDHIKPEMPINIALWDLPTVAVYFKRSLQMVRTTIACLPSFPKAIRLPSAGRPQPLYRANEVIQWAQKFQDRN